MTAKMNAEISTTKPKGVSKRLWRNQFLKARFFSTLANLFRLQ